MLHFDTHVFENKFCKDDENEQIIWSTEALEQ